MLIKLKLKFNKRYYEHTSILDILALIRKQRHHICFIQERDSLTNYYDTTFLGCYNHREKCRNLLSEPSDHSGLFQSMCDLIRNDFLNGHFKNPVLFVYPFVLSCYKEDYHNRRMRIVTLV